VGQQLPTLSFNAPSKLISKIYAVVGLVGNDQVLSLRTRDALGPRPTPCCWHTICIVLHCLRSNRDDSAKCSIDRIRADELTREVFVKQYVGRKPLREKREREKESLYYMRTCYSIYG
jgi:hypothetical protein